MHSLFGRTRINVWYWQGFEIEFDRQICEEKDDKLTKEGYFFCVKDISLLVKMRMKEIKHIHWISLIAYWIIKTAIGYGKQDMGSCIDNKVYTNTRKGAPGSYLLHHFVCVYIYICVCVCKHAWVLTNCTVQKRPSEEPTYCFDEQLFFFLKKKWSSFGNKVSFLLFFKIKLTQNTSLNEITWVNYKINWGESPLRKMDWIKEESR